MNALRQAWRLFQEWRDWQTVTYSDGPDQTVARLHALLHGDDFDDTYDEHLRRMAALEPYTQATLDLDEDRSYS